jgi:hypothetical protein
MSLQRLQPQLWHIALGCVDGYFKSTAQPVHGHDVELLNLLLSASGRGT